jgi:NAD(P)-dependent dehydrogenase (short-subunit alcohol dehydrogenase family)
MMSISKYVIDIFQKQKSGIIVSVASRQGKSGNSDAFSYGAAKAGVINITQSYAKLLVPFGRANSVSPGAVNSGYWLTAPKEEIEDDLKIEPFHKFSEPEDVAETILFLASDKSSMITGQNVSVGAF